MNTFRNLSLAAAVAALGFIAPMAQAQALDDLTVGDAPECPYGYYDYAPYDCAPYGYYGPEWFTGGIFIGAGPWLHGHEGFRGGVDHHFDAKRGYHGPLPGHGERPDPSHSVDRMDHFNGTEMHDGHGGGFEGHEGGMGGHEGGHEGGGGRR